MKRSDISSFHSFFKKVITIFFLIRQCVQSSCFYYSFSFPWTDFPESAATKLKPSLTCRCVCDYLTDGSRWRPSGDSAHHRCTLTFAPCLAAPLKGSLCACGSTSVRTGVSSWVLNSLVLLFSGASAAHYFCDILLM